MAVVQDPDTARCLLVASDTGLPGDLLPTADGVVRRTPPARHLMYQALLCDPCGDVMQAGGALRLRREDAGALVPMGVVRQHVPLREAAKGGREQ
jgi:hypothetical protein